MENLSDKISDGKNLSDDELLWLIGGEYDESKLFAAADAVRQKYYGKAVYLRGLIEISNYCKNDCLYCGIRKSNSKVKRYRLSEEEILDCCNTGYKLGFRTFVLQGGEDAYYTDDVLCALIKKIKLNFKNCAVTLSLGERDRESLKKLFDAGADRYLLRHETADFVHYGRLHPPEMSALNRQRCLFDLKKIGYQTGSGFLIGSPYQTDEMIVKDLRFLQKLNPEMIGVGPFITHKDTPFAGFPCGTAEKTLRLIALLRLLFPKALIPATTALATINEDGRERGLKVGTNVVMPNLSPVKSRGLYELYDNKKHFAEEAAECIEKLKENIKKIGYEAVSDRGDALDFKV